MPSQTSSPPEGKPSLCRDDSRPASGDLEDVEPYGSETNPSQPDVTDKDASDSDAKGFDLADNNYSKATIVYVEGLKEQLDVLALASRLFQENYTRKQDDPESSLFGQSAEAACEQAAMWQFVVNDMEAGHLPYDLQEQLLFNMGVADPFEGRMSEGKDIRYTDPDSVSRHWAMWEEGSSEDDQGISMLVYDLPTIEVKGDPTYTSRGDISEAKTDGSLLDTDSVSLWLPILKGFGIDPSDPPRHLADIIQNPLYGVPTQTREMLTQPSSGSASRDVSHEEVSFVGGDNGPA